MKNLSKSLLLIALFSIWQVSANECPKPEEIQEIGKSEQTYRQKAVNLVKNNQQIQKIAQFAQNHKKKLMGLTFFFLATGYGLSALNESSYEIAPSTKVHNFLAAADIYKNKHYVKNAPIYKKIFPAAQLACLRRMLIRGFRVNRDGVIIDTLNNCIMFFVAD